MFLTIYKMWILSRSHLIYFAQIHQRNHLRQLFVVVVVQTLIHVWLFGLPWTAASQPPLSLTISQSSPKFMSIELVMPSNYLILCHTLLLPLIFSSIKVFSNELALSIGGLSIGASASDLPMSIWGWFPLGLTGLISLLSKGLSGSL